MTPTSTTQIPQCLLVPLEVIINLEPLVIRFQRPQFPKERQILSRILQICQRLGAFHQSMKIDRYLLRVLGDHQHERKVVHPQSEIEQRVGIDEEDYVFHGVFNQLRRAF